MIAGLYDSHCHLDYEAFDGDRSEVIERARAAGVTHLLVPGVDREEWDRPLASDRIAIARAVGVHPQAIEARSDRDLGELERYLDRAVAIGEIGWDTKRADAPIARQIAIADVQLELARARSLPVLLHVVGAQGLAIERLERHGVFRAGGVVHAYSGPAELVPKYVALGFSISFGPSITREHARRPIEAAIATPIDHLLVETDAPCQFPSGRENRRGEPCDLPIVIEAIARARGETPEHIAERSAANAHRLFARDLARPAS